MSRTASPHLHHGLFQALIRLGSIVALGASIFIIAAGVSSRAQAPVRDPEAATAKIPELGSAEFAWLALGVDWLDPSPGLRGPIKHDPGYPRHGNRDGPGQVTPHIGNAKDPVLKPWAARQMQDSNDEVHSGKRGLPFSAQSSCYPGNVPGQLLTPALPFYFIQKPKQVWMIWETDQIVRRISMTEKHSENVRPSWFGESIGHYENGDTLVIDTIGLQTRNSYLDWYRTPHTEKLHVVERFKISADARRLDVLVKVEDPDTFNEPLYLTRRWNKVPNKLLETVCAENNTDHFGMNLFPIPRADKPDF